MRPLSARDIIQVWEQGRDQHPIDRALTILGTAYPDMTRDNLAELSIGLRDTHLLSVREQTFGDALDCFAVCPQCSESLEFTLGVGDIRAEAKFDPGRSTKLIADDHVVEFRLPTSRDLAAAAGCEAVETARSVILERCVVQAARNDCSIKAEDLPDRLIAALADRIDECDPQANVLLDLDCPECAKSWQMPFDIVSFFWGEITAQAKRLLHEVCTLAAAFGWSENEILSLGAVRRQTYLEMVS